MVTVQTQVVENVDQVNREGLQRLQENSQDLTSKAMELTDSWGQAMFIMDKHLVERIFSTLGFSSIICSEVYESLRSLAYVRTQDKKPVVTWHILDAACLTLRGVVDLGSALSDVNDNNIENFLDDNIDIFDILMNVMPEYTRNLMFSPEVASVVVATLGGNLSSYKIYDLAAKYGHQATKDLEGRRGVSTQFIRSLTLTISARFHF
jgi:hypothetical protein